MSSENHALLVTVGKRIRALRKQKEWTQTDMAVCLDMNRGHISDIERGKREAGLITLQIIPHGKGQMFHESKEFKMPFFQVA